MGGEAVELLMGLPQGRGRSYQGVGVASNQYNIATKKPNQILLGLWSLGGSGEGRDRDLVWVFAPPGDPNYMGSVTRYEFIGFGAMEVTKPYEFIGFGAMEVTKPYEFIGFGA